MCQSVSVCVCVSECVYDCVCVTMCAGQVCGKFIRLFCFRMVVLCGFVSRKRETTPQGSENVLRNSNCRFLSFSIFFSD